MEDQIRQGDVLLREVSILPPGNLTSKTEIILAEGEVTGHAHKLVANAILDWCVGDQRYIRVEGEEAGELYHEDHDPQPVAVVMPRKTYQVIPQEEWNLESQWRKVKD